MDLQFEKKIGKNIRTLRKHRGLTQEETSARLQTVGCDLTRSALAKIEVGQRHIYADELKSLCSVFEIAIDELFTESNTAPATE